MGLQTAATLYPVNTTTVDTGATVDIRLLDSAQAGATDTTQTASFTHTQDNQNRTFNPGNAGVTANNNPGAVQKIGWALRLAEDCTPADNANCNASVPAGVHTLSISIALNQSGGTYTGGTYAPLLAWAIFRYDPATDTGTLITFSTSPSTSWDYTPGTGDLGTFKTAVLPGINVAAPVELLPGEILLLQIGLGTQTVPNPTLGTATWTATLAVDDPNTKFDWAAGQTIKQICYTGAAITASGDATGVLGVVKSTAGTLDGNSAVAGTFGATAAMAGVLDGAGVVDGLLSSIASFAGTLNGNSETAGVLGAVAAVAGTVDGSGELAAVLGAIGGMTAQLEGVSALDVHLGAIASMSSDLSGSGEVAGSVSSLSGTVGSVIGSGELDGHVTAVIGTVGTIEPPAGGGGETVFRPVLLLADD